jgi:spore coat protein A
MWEDPITERPEVGSTEVWELLNTLTDTHPFHIHLIQFQVLDRRLFDVQEFLAHGDVKFLDDAEAPDDNELGWKDTVQVYPQMVNRIIMKFLPFTGYYVYHCHILEHEDMDMMRPFQVIAKQNSPGGEK